MKKLQFKKDIKAPAARVYNVMLGIDNIKTYQEWTAAFNPTSTYEGDPFEGSWSKGSKVLFVGQDENGKRGGMVSEIVENKPSEFVSIRHYGLIDGDKEITTGPAVEKWAGSLENYSFQEKNGITSLVIDIDVAEEYIDMFSTMWPAALDKLKEMVEG
ncbi:MAG: SRPBCC domain-containing protein [Imperialibacter sp.]|uniref:SRPBCC family protein n=1 Tax=Imperialibacter sp. TaxID=2038411 RepID=UPI0032EBCA1C